MILAIFLVACVLLGAAYLLYGRFLEKQAGADPSKSTPSHTMTDGVDYVPTSDLILFGHHFSAIAGAGPIAGPIIAGLAFGWAPAIVWIVLGAIFIGGMHDYLALFISIRNKGRSIGQICKQLINPFTYNAFLLFVLFTLVYVLIVFTDMTASTFAPPSAEKALASMTEEGAKLSNLEGGTVATASLIYIGLALLFGVCIYRFKMRVSVGTLIFVPLVFLSLGAGHMAPLLPTDMPHLWGSAKNFWIVILLIYCFFASVLPVWLLLQPRDYLSSYLLYASLLGGTVGLIAAGTTGHALITYPAFTGFDNARLGSLYPFLFITIACGAVSGFHSVVASGTTAKQLDNEHSARRIGYGSMLVEGVLAVLALTTVMVLPAGVKTGTPVETFAKGLGSFLQVLGLKPELGVTFGMMAVSTFLLTTLDACTRLTRFILQELFGIPNSLAGRFLSTAIVLSLPALVVFQEITDATGNKVSAWQAIWPAFGASNQLLAALALLVIYVWMRRTGRRTIFVLIPMLFMCVTTLVALATLAVRNLAPGKNLFVGGLCSALFVLALTVIASTVWSLRKSAPAIPAEKTGD